MQLSARKTQITSGSTQISVNHYRWMESPIQRQLPDDDRTLDHKGMGTQDMHFGRASSTVIAQQAVCHLLSVIAQQVIICYLYLITKKF
jgi:hypothetical protein